MNLFLLVTTLYPINPNAMQKVSSVKIDDALGENNKNP